MSAAKEEAEAQVNALIDEEKWDEALRECRRIADELHEEPGRLPEVLRHVKQDAQQLRAEDTGSSLYLLGEVHLLDGPTFDEDECYRCSSRAAEKGHLLSRFEVGRMIANGLGVRPDEARGFALMVKAAEDGCPAACDWAGTAYEQGHGVQQSYRRAAQWYLRAGTRNHANGDLAFLLRDHPLECTPFGEWREEWHALVPLEVHRAMRSAMLLCRRLCVPTGVARIVAGYVCTEGEEWAELMRKTRGG